MITAIDNANYCSFAGANAVSAITNAINHIMSKTCVIFRNTDPADLDMLYFHPGTT